jgi:hypothetical protein
MNYNKPPLSFSDQIARLQDRGFNTDNISCQREEVSEMGFSNNLYDLTFLDQRLSHLIWR